MITAVPGRLSGILILTPPEHQDTRGSFMECYSRRELAALGIACQFVQDNQSYSRGGVLRGLHYQLTPGQAKLVRVIQGEIFDVVVDLRRDSPTFGQWEGFQLSAAGRQQLFVPVGFAHGFCVLENQSALVAYKCSAYYNPATERGIRWDDPILAIAWPLTNPILSDRDRQLPGFHACQLPRQKPAPRRRRCQTV